MTPAAEAPGATGNRREYRCRTERSPCTEQRLRRDRARTGRSVPPGRGELAIHRQRILGDQDFTGVGAGFTLRGQHSSGAALAACSPAQVAHRQPAVRARTWVHTQRPPGQMTWHLALLTCRQTVRGRRVRSRSWRLLLAKCPPLAAPVRTAVSSVPRGLHRRPDPP
jgi:hypothetical protein